MQYQKLESVSEITIIVEVSGSALLASGLAESTDCHVSVILSFSPLFLVSVVALFFVFCTFAAFPDMFPINALLLPSSTSLNCFCVIYYMHQIYGSIGMTS